MAILTHLLRTLLVVGFFVGTFFLLFYLLPSIAIYLILILWLPFTYYSAKWQAYFAPVAKPVKNRSWNSDDGHEMESILEKAQVHASILGGITSTRQQTWRISVYDRTKNRRIRRAMIGDNVTYFGEAGGYYWFYIEDRFQCKVSGLTAFDRETGDIKFNRPKSEATFIQRTGRSHIIEMDVQDEVSRVDLKELASSIEDDQK